jgi:hypothetical protein
MSDVPDDWSFLNAHNDIHHNRIDIGTHVRTFDFPNVAGGRFWGLDLDGERACYAEGTIEAIGEDIIEGCPRYRISVTRIVFRGENALPTTPQHLYPPLNGTPSLLQAYPTFGVTAI